VDNATRIKALSRLAQSRTSDAQQALEAELDEAISDLRASGDYDVLEHALSVLGTIGFRFDEAVVSAVDGFIRSVERRTLEYSADYEGLRTSIGRYRNAYTLTSKGIEVLSGLRYLQTPAVLQSLLWASTSTSESVRNDAVAALSAVAKYNIAVFFGDRSHSGMGALPQLSVVETLEKMGDDDLVRQFPGVRKLLDGTLSSAMERSEWTSTQVTIHRAVTPPTPEVVSVRARSIDLFRRLYGLVTDQSTRLSIIQALSAAARVDRHAVSDSNYIDMIANNACRVLEFFADVVSTADLQTVQKIEHSSYWIFFHTGRPEVRSAALAVKARIDSISEYEVYKTLIGFEGVFGDWESEERSVQRALSSQDQRTASATKYAHEIQAENYELWRVRILGFAGTKSDDLATFPVFFHFLEEFARCQPHLALKLLAESKEVMAPFAIPILKGAWEGNATDEARRLILDWTAEAESGDSLLFIAGVRLFLSARTVDIDVLRTMLEKAASLRSASALNQIASVAIGRFGSCPELGDQLKDLFLACIQILTPMKSAGWVRNVWSRAEASKLVAKLSAKERADMLLNLISLPRVDYQAEQILGGVAEISAAEVIDLFCARAERESELDADNGLQDEYEAIPYELNNLQTVLSKEPGEAVRITLYYYSKDSRLFQFRGARLLRTIFPTFSDGFERELIKVVREGKDSDVEYVVEVLRAYDGETFLHTVCKEVVKRVPSGSPLLGTVAIALESTGVVSGEFGMAEAYDRKRLEILDWLDDSDEKVRVFARAYVDDLGKMSERERARAKESIELRKFKYGDS
jgi:hypothetical protein